MTYAALIFDMDGTIVDNMGVHNEAWAIWHARHNLPFDEATFFERTAGRHNPEIIGALMPGKSEMNCWLMARKRKRCTGIFMRRACAPSMVSWTFWLMPSARAFPKLSARLHRPAIFAVVLDALNLRPRFDTIVSPSQGFRGKPHPDMFLAAAERMKVNPAQCLVFEDAPLGVEAARNAGMKAVAMLTMLEERAFANFGNVIACIRDFSQFDLTLLRERSA